MWSLMMRSRTTKATTGDIQAVREICHAAADLQLDLDPYVTLPASVVFRLLASARCSVDVTNPPLSNSVLSEGNAITLPAHVVEALDVKVGEQVFYAKSGERRYEIMAEGPFKRYTNGDCVAVVMERVADAVNDLLSRSAHRHVTVDCGDHLALIWPKEDE